MNEHELVTDGGSSPLEEDTVVGRDVSGGGGAADVGAAAEDPETAEVERALTTGEMPLLTRLNRRGFRLVQIADAVWLYAVMVATMFIRFGWGWRTYPKWLYLVSFFVILVIFTASLYFGGLYERDPRLGSPPVLPRAIRQTTGAAGLTALLTLAGTGAARELGISTDRALPMPITNLVVLVIVGAAGVATNRWIANQLRYRNQGPPRLLLVGDPDDLELARGHIERAGRNVRIEGEADASDRVLYEVHRLEISDVLIVSGDWIEHLYPDVIDVLETAGVSVLQRVSARDTMFGLERVRQVGGMPFVLLRSQTIAVSRANFKRFTDLVYLLLASPLILVALALVTGYQLVVAGRPLLFFQTRVGKDGELFRMVKFRTMHERAEEDGAPQLATQDDPRIIPACRWVRATRLDELPQVWNVLKGEMSLVGPRPERPELTQAYERQIPGYARRYEIPPGLTGLAQIHGRYHTDPEYKLGYDLQYLVNWSPILDLEILLRTVYVVVARRI
jgi:lipopolysaccharide/colanic/teichoic acid biosynthesis glycosyltransferase